MYNEANQMAENGLAPVMRGTDYPADYHPSHVTQPKALHSSAKVEEVYDEYF